jgi:hypothetical protein
MLLLNLVGDSIDRFRLWLSCNQETAPARIMEELRGIHVFGSFRPADRVLTYLGGIFSTRIISNGEIALHKHVLAQWSGSIPSQRSLISGFEWFCGEYCAILLKAFPVVLKTLFDEDLIDEDVVLAWYADTVPNELSASQSLISVEQLQKLHASARPFVTWLQEADVEDEDDIENGGEEIKDDTGRTEE